MFVAYIRGSCDEVIERQRVILSNKKVDKIYIDKQIGAKETSELKKMISEIETEDTVVVESLTRLSRSTAEILSIVERLEIKGVELISINENWDTTTELGKQFMQMIAKSSKIERENLKQSQLQGIQQAKNDGKYAGKKKINPDEKIFKMVYTQWVKKEGEEGKITTKEAMGMLGLKPNTFYRRVGEYSKEKENENELIDFG